MTQKEALKILKSGENVFLTGAAGSGKTYILNQYIKYLKKKDIKHGITASTGIAATHLNGITIHSWSGIGIKDKLDENDISNITSKYDLLMRFMENKVLIIDEISMLHSYRLDMVDKVCRAFKRNNIPFGGMQIVMCGDFFQLPPVTKAFEESCFAYKSKVWNEMNLKVCYLEEQHRQSDNKMLKILNDIRSGEVSEESYNNLQSRYKQKIKGFTNPTKLYTHNIDVDSINKVELERISDIVHTYNMSWTGPRELVEVIINGCLAPEVLSLKVGAIVMFVKNNYTAGYVNGTLGKVIYFDQEDLPVIELKSGKKIHVVSDTWGIEDRGVIRAQIEQLPIRLAWAITIHKSQGMSLDAAEIDLSKSFVPGMGYVALSKVRTLEGMRLLGFNQLALKINEEVLEMDKKFRKLSKDFKKHQ